MIEWIISSSVLIAALLLLRLLFRGKISARLQYALWALVLLRLLIPGSIVESAASVSNLLSSVTEKPVAQAASGTLTPQVSYDLAVREVLDTHDYSQEVYAALPEAQQEQIIETYQPQIQQRLETYETAYDAARILKTLWLVGAAVMGLFLLVSNFRFYGKLRRTRARLDISASLPVYRSCATQTPCLFGLFRPSIYLPDTDIDEKAMSYILAHEKTHYRHLDHIWALARCVCLALHWYNPLVWLAVKASRADSELACDEGTLAKLGDHCREGYGRTLIEMSCVKPSVADYLLTSTTMTADKKTLRQRIQAIAKKQKVILAAVISLAAAVLILVGCTFTGAGNGSAETPTEEPTSAPTQPTEQQPTDPQPTEPSLPAGTPLTDKEIAWFNEHFFTDEWAEWDESGPDVSTKRLTTVNIRNQFLFQEYDAPEEIDLALLFFQGFSLSEYPTDEEKIAVHEMLGMQWDPEPGCSIDLLRVPRKNMEAVFLENTGLTIAETQQVGMDRKDYYYLEQTDAYYHSHGEFAYDCFIVSEGVKLEDGSVVLRYYRPRSETSAEGIVTLTPHDGSYWFVANQHIDPQPTEPQPTEPQPTDAVIVDPPVFPWGDIGAATDGALRELPLDIGTYCDTYVWGDTVLLYNDRKCQVRSLEDGSILQSGPGVGGNKVTVTEDYMIYYNLNQKIVFRNRDLKTEKMVEVDVDVSVSEMLFSQDGTRAYYHIYPSNTIIELDIQTGEKREIPVDGAPIANLTSLEFGDSILRYWVKEDNADYWAFVDLKTGKYLGKDSTITRFQSWDGGYYLCRAENGQIFDQRIVSNGTGNAIMPQDRGTDFAETWALPQLDSFFTLSFNQEGSTVILDLYDRATSACTASVTVDLGQQYQQATDVFADPSGEYIWLCLKTGTTGNYQMILYRWDFQANTTTE